MENFKNFSFGGLFQAGRKMAPPWGSFRRFTNAYKDPTRTIMPYGRGAEVTNTPTLPTSNGAYGFTHRGPVCSQVFRKGILQLHAMYNAGYRGVLSYLGPENTAIPIMQAYNFTGMVNSIELDDHMAKLSSGNFSTCVVARKAYINAMTDLSQFDSTKPFNGFTPTKPWLMSFDGLRPRGAGLPLPWTTVDPSGTLGNFYVRTVYATIGMDGELILSPYLQQKLSSATRDVYVSGYAPYATPRPDCVGANTFPTYRRPEDHLFNKLLTSSGFDISGSNSRYFDTRFIESFGAAHVTSGELSIVRASYDPMVVVGDWLMVDLGSNVGTVPATLYMFKVKTFGATTVFERNIKYLDQNSVTWIDADLDTLWTSWGDISADLQTQFLGTVSNTSFSNIFAIISYSTTATAGYVVHDILPVAWESAKIYAARSLSTAKAFKVPWAGVVSSFMADWYDTTQVKTTFPPLKGVTNYKELLVGFDANAIYFSDISLGGSTEMVSGLSNLIPYGSEYGDLTAVCGSESFMYVSRERKNYIITGDIAGSSFNIDECDSAVPGAYNSKCVTNAWAGQVIFMNASGIFSVNSAGTIKDLSDEIKGLFFRNNLDGNLFDKSIFKTIQQTRTNGYDRSIFKFFLEESRGFVILFTGKADANFGVTGANMLVFDTNDGKWYEFEAGTVSSVEALYGKIIALGTNRATEDGVMRGTEKQLLVTQRITQDVPSLEKQVCQLKLFGGITPKTSDSIRSMTVGQINDWANFNASDRSGWITNVVFTPVATDVYALKQRLDSSKTVATSIVLESSATGSFSLEGMEIEGAIIQEGMKK